jgi:hypothetical protein
LPTPHSLIDFFNDLDLGDIHVRRPDKFIFFCGGVFSNDDQKPRSLRQYLLKTKNMSRSFNAKVVLAEEANQLYRDTEFSDLISFEEEIAVISSVVLVIAESAGSLAELGAFATSDHIRPAPAVIMRSDYYEQNSFVRYGPVERLRQQDEGRVGVFPWRTTASDSIITSSTRGHLRSIANFINAQVKSFPDEFLYKNSGLYKDFAIILWVLHLSRAISITEIEEYINDIGHQISRKQLKNKLYCLKLAGWAGSYTYSNKTYWHPRVDIDPISRYSYRPGTSGRDTTRRKLAATTEIRHDLSVPNHVSRHIISVIGGAG